MSYAYVSSPEGTWSFTPTAGAFMVGPGQGTGNYYTSSLADVTTRDCLFDDEYEAYLQYELKKLLIKVEKDLKATNSI